VRGEASCVEIGELLGAYALDALDTQEATLVTVHVANCPRCAQELDDHLRTVGMIASVGGEAPPEAWRAIAGRIAGEEDPSGAGSTAGRQLPRLLPSHRPSVSRWYKPVAGLTAAAVIAAGVLIGTKTARLDELNRRVNQLSAAARQSGGFQGPAAALVDPTARHLVLTSTGRSAAPVGQLVILPSGSAYMLSSDMPALPANSTYQLWSVVRGRAISVALLGPHPVTVAFSVDPGVTATAYLVTVEPAGGVVAPTAPPVARSSS
jgi:hypothetical protein